jgi:hypothetical protein
MGKSVRFIAISPKAISPNSHFAYKSLPFRLKPFCLSTIRQNGSLGEMVIRQMALGETALGEMALGEMVIHRPYREMGRVFGHLIPFHPVSFMESSNVSLMLWRGWQNLGK